jgi:hypothetical protein
VAWLASKDTQTTTAKTFGVIANMTIEAANVPCTYAAEAVLVAA